MTSTAPASQRISRPGHAATTAGRGTVVIIGGGLAGMLAARVLCEVAEHVVIVERDHYPAGPAWRPGVPQANHAHLLLEAGHRGLEFLLPGILTQLRDAGAVDVVIGSDLHWRNAIDWMAPHRSPLSFLSVGRSLLDHLIRRRVLAAPNVSVIDRTKAVGLLTTGRTVTGVLTRHAGHKTVEELPAELVMDASGRDTATDRWLVELGFAHPPVLEVNAGCVYSSRRIHLPANVIDNLGYKALYLQTSRDQPWTGSMLPIEHDQYIVSLGGMTGGQPGRGETGFEFLLDQLRDPTLRNIVRRADFATPVAWLPAGPSIRRDIRRDPTGLIRFGDAAAKFNPVYGQGMTCTILEVLALHEQIARHGDLGPAAQRAVRRTGMAKTSPAWLMSSSEDARLPATTGAPRGPLIRAQHRYLDRISVHATQSPTTAATFTSVMSMTDSPLALFRPHVAIPTLLGIRGSEPR